MNQNGSNLVQVLLSNISSYAENPGIFNFFKDSLVSTIHNSIGNVILAQFIYDTKINEHYFSILKSALLIV